MVKKRAESVVKVYPEDMEWIRDEQYRIRKATGHEPAQPQIIADIIRRATTDPVRDKIVGDQQTSELLAGLDADQLGMVEQFVDLIRQKHVIIPAVLALLNQFAPRRHDEETAKKSRKHSRTA